MGGWGLRAVEIKLPESLDQVKNGNYMLRLHAVERSSLRGINPLDLKEALLVGGSSKHILLIIVAKAVLCMAQIRMEEIFISFVEARDMLRVITVYEPDLAEWIDFVKRRRRQ